MDRRADSLSPYTLVPLPIASLSPRSPPRPHRVPHGSPGPRPTRHGPLAIPIGAGAGHHRHRRSVAVGLGLREGDPAPWAGEGVVVVVLLLPRACRLRSSADCRRSLASGRPFVPVATHPHFCRVAGAVVCSTDGFKYTPGPRSDPPCHHPAHRGRYRCRLLVQDLAEPTSTTLAGRRAFAATRSLPQPERSAAVSAVPHAAPRNSSYIPAPRRGVMKRRITLFHTCSQLQPTW